jgi:hypothetical protein
MNNTLKEKIEMLSESELAELSLKETLSTEEALCDAADMAFLVETADLPVDISSVKELIGVGDFDKYQFFNQNQIVGLSDEDLEDYDPDNKTPDSELNENSLNHDYIIRANADATNGDLSVQFNDMPSNMESILTAGNTLRHQVADHHTRAAGVPVSVAALLAGTIEAVNPADEVNGIAHSAIEENYSPSKTSGSLVSFLLGESDESDDDDDEEDEDYESSEEDEDDIELDEGFN